MTKSRMMAAAGAMALLMGTAGPLSAGQGDTPASEDDKEEKLIEQLAALTTTIEGLRDKPADTVATGGGKLEGYILSTIAIDGAARKIISEAFAGGGATRKTIVVAGTDSLSVDAWLIFQANVEGLCYRIAGDFDCKPVAGAGRPVAPDDNAAGGSIPAVIGAVLPLLSSLLRSETEISSLGPGLVDSKLLAKAVVGICGRSGQTMPVRAQGGGSGSGVPQSVALPECGEIYLFEPPRLRDSIRTSDSWKKLSDLIQRKNELARGKKLTDAQKEAIKAVDLFAASAMTANDKGVVPLIEAIRGERLAVLGEEKDVLTVHIEQSDGTVLKRKALDVALFGAPSVRASGGVIASYSLETKVNKVWAIRRSGGFACATTLTELKRVHRLDDKVAAKCQ